MRYLNPRKEYRISNAQLSATNKINTGSYQLICAIIESAIRDKAESFLKSDMCKYYCAAIGLEYECIKEKVLPNLKGKESMFGNYEHRFTCNICKRRRLERHFDFDCNSFDGRVKYCKDCK